jgi:hypothetical protein
VKVGLQRYSYGSCTQLGAGPTVHAHRSHDPVHAVSLSLFEAASNNSSNRLTSCVRFDSRFSVAGESASEGQLLLRCSAVDPARAENGTHETLRARSRGNMILQDCVVLLHDGASMMSAASAEGRAQVVGRALGGYALRHSWGPRRRRLQPRRGRSPTIALTTGSRGLTMVGDEGLSVASPTRVWAGRAVASPAPRDAFGHLGDGIFIRWVSR